MAKGLLETGADPNHCNRQGDFPILLAAGGGFIDILKLLIKFGGKVDFVTSLDPQLFIMLQMEVTVKL